MFDLARHIDLFNPNTATTPHIIGAGAVGSHIAYLLAKLGCPAIHLYDFDTVEGHNIANQFFTPKDIGKAKVDAVTTNINYVADGTIGCPHNIKVTKAQDLALTGDDTIFMVVDSLEARHEIGDSMHEAFLLGFMIETRMGVFNAEVYTLPISTPRHYKRWKESIPGDDTPLEVSACGSPITVGMTAAGLAAMAVWSYVSLNKFGEWDFFKKYDFRNAVAYSEAA